MTRGDFQKLSRERLQDAEVLLRGRRFGGAFYFAGYAVECALKACIAKRTRRYDFPERQAGRHTPYTHDLATLAELADLGEPLRLEKVTNLGLNWSVVKHWTSEDRYKRKDAPRAREMMLAVTDRGSGVLPWIEQRW